MFPHHLAHGPLWKCGIPGIRGSLTVAHHMAHAPPVEVWNSMKSWKSDDYTSYTNKTKHWKSDASTPLEVCNLKEVWNSRNSWKSYAPLSWKYATPRKCGIPGIRGSQTLHSRLHMKLRIIGKSNKCNLEL